jgi:hypothetical protein
VPLTAETVADAAADDHGLAAGLFQTFTHVGGAAVLPLVILAAATRTDAAGGVGHAAALTAGYHLGFALAAGLLLVGAVAAMALLPGRR